MSRFVFFLIFLLYFYILVVWGKIAFLLLVAVGTGPYIYYVYYKKVGHWPWSSAVATSLGQLKGPGISESRPKITFADVAGIDEAKEELLEIVDFLKNKDRYL